MSQTAPQRQQGRPGGPGGRGGRQGDRPRRPRREPVVEVWEPKTIWGKKLLLVKSLLWKKFMKKVFVY